MTRLTHGRCTGICLLAIGRLRIELWRVPANEMIEAHSHAHVISRFIFLDRNLKVSRDPSNNSPSPGGEGSPSTVGTGEGGRRPGEGSRGETNPVGEGGHGTAYRLPKPLVRWYRVNAGQTHAGFTGAKAAHFLNLEWWTGQGPAQSPAHDFETDATSTPSPIGGERAGVRGAR